MPGENGRRVYRFGVFEADEAAGELRKHGLRIKLHSQPFQVLLMLLEKPSAIVTREEMRQRLWGNETFVDFDHSLNTAVSKIRDVLGDSASVPRYVETIAGKGYRFVASVTTPTPLPERPAPRLLETPPLPEPERPAVIPAVLTTPLLTTPAELPVAPRRLVRTLLLLIQAMYLGFYFGALANLGEIHDIFLETGQPHPAWLIWVLVVTAMVLIPVRLFLFAAIAMDYRELPSRFAKLFPSLLAMDLLWAISPFLLIHHINAGLALGLSAPLVYVPFAQRSLILMQAARLAER